MSTVSVRDVGRMFGIDLPSAPGKAKCPLRKHHRTDKTFRVFKGSSGDDVWKCWSCDAPDNVGDAVGLYAKLSGLDRTTAWKRLKDLGHEVPGGDRARGADQPYGPPTAPRPMQPKIGIRGTKVDKVLPLAKTTLESWLALADADVRSFLIARGFSETFDFRSFGVTPMPGGCVGFVYVDPMTGKPCRVKVRTLRDKRFWNEPRPDPQLPGAKALAPLWLADRLAFGASTSAVIITEGELDALSLASVGLTNVVSLPDGAESAATVSLEPLCGIFRTWFVAMDEDEAGVKAWRILRDRARDAGADPIRLTWARKTGEELEFFKDANEAMVAGFTAADFLACMKIAAPAGKVA